MHVTSPTQPLAFSTSPPYARPMSDKQRFARVLRTRDVIALSFGAMIGWSWVFVTGVWLLDAGTLGTVIAFAIGGVASVRRKAEWL